MKIHEYQAKEVLSRFGVPVPEGKVARDAGEAADAYDGLGAGVCAVKAQIHAGGRGKAGGIRLVRSREEARGAAAAILGKRLVTAQTGPQGRVVRRVLVEKGGAFDRELYVGVALDRREARPVLLACAEGGVEIEEVARRAPRAILREGIDPAFGLFPHQARRLAFDLGLPAEAAKRFAVVAQALARAFSALDLQIVELNPLVVTAEGGLLALDAKVVFEDAGLFRHPEAAGLRDPEEEDPREAEAAAHGLSYVALDGDVGCMVNGAGLAMATLDLLLLHGARPANFLDIGGGASRERVVAAFRLLLGDPRVRAFLVNIFGGIVRCDLVAEGLVAAAREVGLLVPLVARLEGTKVEEGRRALLESGLPITPAGSMDEAAERVAAFARTPSPA